MIDEILKKYPKDVKVVIKHIGLTEVTKYALAAHKQDKYKEMYHKIMTNQDEVKENEELCVEYAKDLNLDIEQFKKDSKSSEIEHQIINELKEYLKSSPTESIVIPRFLIQGRELWTFKMSTRKTIEDFSKIIDQELEKLD